MIRIIEADESSEIHVEGRLLGVPPHSRYELEQRGRMLILRPVEEVRSVPNEASLRDSLSPDQRAEEFLAWVRQQPASDIHLTNEQLRRENMYE